MDVIENTLKEMGIGREQIFLERFVSPADRILPRRLSETEQDSVLLHIEVGRRNASGSL